MITCHDNMITLSRYNKVNVLSCKRYQVILITCYKYYFLTRTAHTGSKCQLWNAQVITFIFATKYGEAWKCRRCMLQVIRVKGIDIRLYRKGTYILADIHGMDHFCTKLAPPPYNRPRSCVSKIHTPMVMVWFGNV
jgi:hypothetical protein